MQGLDKWSPEVDPIVGTRHFWVPKYIKKQSGGSHAPWAEANWQTNVDGILMSKRINNPILNHSILEWSFNDLR